MYIIWTIFELCFGKTSLPALVCDRRCLSQSDSVSIFLSVAGQERLGVSKEDSNETKQQHWMLSGHRENSEFVVTMETSPFDRLSF